MGNLVMTARAAFTLLDKVAFKKDFNINDTIVVVGAPRSGTTWLMELLGCIPEYTTLFEPLNPFSFPCSKDAGYTYRSYLLPDECEERKYDYMHKVLSGKVTSLYPWYRFSLPNLVKRIYSKKLLVKFIRANRMLPWMSENFDLRLICYIVRHPYSVVASQINTGYTGYNGEEGLDFVPDKKIILNELHSMGNVNPDIVNKVKYLDKKEEFLSFIWCLDNIIPLAYRSDNLVTIKYEEMVDNGGYLLNKILGKIGEERELDKIVKKLKVKSFTTVKKIKGLSKFEKDNISRVLGWFNFYVDDEEYGLDGASELFP